MRLPIANVLLAGGLLLSSARAQETKHWPLARISFPVDLAEFNKLSPKPVSIRFYAAPPGKEFKLIHNHRPGELVEIVDTKDPAATPRRGFTYDSAADGDMEFAVQYEYGDGTLTPAKLTPQFRIRFDTRPPGVKAVASGTSGIKWQVEDENLLRDSIRVEGRYPGETQWQFLNTGELKADDTFKWNIPPGKTLEVRVYARDRAGHENRSLPIKLTGDDRRADATDRPKGGGTAPTPPGSFGDPVKSPAVGKTGYGGLDDLPANRPKIEYVSTNKLMVRSKVTHVTRSGVKAAQLYVLEPTSGADWKAAGKDDKLAITADDPDEKRWVGIEYVAPRDGMYGFILQPVSGAGTKLEDPRAGDSPQYLVEVDTTLPEMEFKKVSVTGSGLNGPLVEIEWEAKDKNLTTEPIVLEYSEDQKTWKAIAAKATNTGRFTWEITDKKLWKFWVRGSATDMAGNTKLATYHDEKGTPTPVLVDLDKPSGNVDKVNPNGPATTPPPGSKGIGFEPPPGTGGGGVSAVPPPDKLPITPVGSGERPKPADPTPRPVPGPVTPPPQPPVQGPPIPELPPKKDEPKKPDPPKVEPKKDEPKKPEEKKIEVPLPPIGGEPISLPPIVPPPAETTPVAPLPIPPVPNK